MRSQDLLSGSYHVRGWPQKDGRRSGKSAVGVKSRGDAAGSCGLPFATGVISIFFNLGPRASRGPT